MKEKCANCGNPLTKTNITLALEDAGESPEIVKEERKADPMNQSIITLDHYTFYCPSYTDERGCPGYGEEDEEKPAYWMYR